MTAGRKQLPPVSGDPVAELLLSRFSEPEVAVPVGPPAVAQGAEVPGPTETPVPKVGQHPPGRARREPAGMTRRTIYVPTATAEALDEAADRIRAAAGGRVSKHEALTAIIAAGVAQAAAALDQLRANVRRDLDG